MFANRRTLAAAAIDPRRIFADGQAYVALSRTTDEAALRLLSPLRPAHVKCERRAQTFYRLTAAFQRADGTSVFRPRNAARYSGAAVLAAEDRLLARSREQVAPRLADATIAHALQPHRGRTLGDDQRAALAAIASSGRMLDLLVGPAGAGKTTALRALRRADEGNQGQQQHIDTPRSRLNLF
mgnify:CR=1 FL=1